MKRIIFAVLALVLLAACANNAQQLNKTGEVSVQEVFPGQNTGCTSQCEADGCIDNDFYTCKTNEQGCTYQVKVGVVKGKCDVGCFSDNDCAPKEYCSERKTESRSIFKCLNISD